MNSRKEFLTRLFASLEADAVSHCVERNYEDVFADPTSDVDILVEKRDWDRFEACLRAAAADTGHRLVQRARYINDSCVFIGPTGGFVRIDFSAEFRWRLFPVLPARAILASRQKYNGFHVPHPWHESVILFTQAMWRNRLKPRYRERLVHLYQTCPDKEGLHRVYRDAFGGFGERLAEFHARLPENGFEGQFCAQLKRSLVVKLLTRPAGLGAFARNLGVDFSRLWERLRRPAGISLLFASAAQGEKNFDELLRPLEIPFPAEKRFIHLLAPTDSVRNGTLQGPNFGLRRWRTLFRGGIFVDYCRLESMPQPPLGAPAHGSFPARTFVWIEDAGGNSRFTHAGTGRTASFSPAPADGKTDPVPPLVDFISSVLEQESRAREKNPAR